MDKWRNLLAAGWYHHSYGLNIFIDFATSLYQDVRYLDTYKFILMKLCEIHNHNAKLITVYFLKDTVHRDMHCDNSHTKSK